jgi:Flp pilus assembly protein TadD
MAAKRLKNRRTPLSAAVPAPVPVQDLVMPSVDRSKETFFLKALILLLACLWVYAPAYHGDWLWDDDQLVIANPVMKEPGGIWKIWFAPRGADYFPLTMSTLWAEWQIWGANPTGFHMVNIILHAVGSLLVWRVFRQLGVPCAWLGALIYAVHPLNVESVAWISERKNTLSLPLFLASASFWLRYDTEKQTRHYVWSVVLFLLAMLAKTSVVMFPVVLLLHAWWKRGTITFRDIRNSVPFFLISLVLGIVTYLFQNSRAIGHEVIPIGGALSRAATAGMSLWFYLWKSLWPSGLMPIYPRWQVDPPSWWQIVLPWLGVLVVAGVLWNKRATWGRHALFGLGFFALILLPILGFVKISYMRISWVADHFVHVPLLGITALMAAFAGQIATAMRQRIYRGFLSELISVMMALAVVSWLAVRSFQLAEIYKDEDALWNYTLSKNFDAWQAHNRLGVRKMFRGEEDEAMEHFRNAVRLRPDLGETQNNLAVALQQRGRKAEALKHFRLAAEASPNDLATLTSLAHSLHENGHLAEAFEKFKLLAERKPDDPEILLNYGILLCSKGEFDAGIAHLRKALEIRPDFEAAKGVLERAIRERNAHGSPALPQPGSAP